MTPPMNMKTTVIHWTASGYPLMSDPRSIRPPVDMVENIRQSDWSGDTPAASSRTRLVRLRAMYTIMNDLAASVTLLE